MLCFLVFVGRGVGGKGEGEQSILVRVSREKRGGGAGGAPGHKRGTEPAGPPPPPPPPLGRALPLSLSLARPAAAAAAGGSGRRRRLRSRPFCSRRGGRKEGSLGASVNLLSPFSLIRTASKRLSSAVEQKTRLFGCRGWGRGGRGGVGGRCRMPIRMLLGRMIVAIGRGGRKGGFSRACAFFFVVCPVLGGTRGRRRRAILCVGERAKRLSLSLCPCRCCRLRVALHLTRQRGT